MFHNFVVYFFVEFAVVLKDCIHLLEFLKDETILVYDGFDGDAAPYEHLIDRNELTQLLVVDQLFETGNFVF
jgi:hypothetical protein